MSDRELRARLESLHAPLGAERRRLCSGRWTLGLDGLSREIARVLDERWGPFVEARDGGEYRISFLRAGAAWLPPARPGERYRLEPLRGGERPAALSYHFAVVEESSARAWRLGLSDASSEPIGRVVENAVRFVTARIAILEGGFAMHAAGVELGGRAHLFAGPSGSGKTTAVALAAPAHTLGDDFGLVLPEGQRWLAPALPFDNAERATHAPRELLPVAGIYRLFQAADTRVETPSGSLGAASLMSCVAFPWAMPDAAAALLERVSAFVQGGRFHHLYFTKNARLLEHLDP